MDLIETRLDRIESELRDLRTYGDEARRLKIKREIRDEQRKEDAAKAALVLDAQRKQAEIDALKAEPGIKRRTASLGFLAAIVTAAIAAISAWLGSMLTRK
jgi:hypothetical protein